MKSFNEWMENFEIKTLAQARAEKDFISDFKQVVTGREKQLKDAGINLYAGGSLGFYVDNGRGFDKEFSYNQGKEAAAFALTLLRNELRGKSGAGGGGGMGGEYFGS